MSAEKPLEGKVVVVTGAGAGIGRGLVLAYGKAGAKVVVSSRTPSTVEEAAEEIRAAGGEAIGVPCDVGYRDQVYSLIDKTIEAYGALHVLVNNAQGFGTAAKPSIAPILRPFEETDEDEWEFCWRTGATATLWAMKAAFPHMKAAGYGRVINFSSAVGQNGAEKRVPYNATKEAIRAMTRTAAREWGPYGITVNAISPFIATRLIDILKRKMPDDYEQIVQSVPVRRAGTTEQDLAPLAIFLAGEGSGYMTGQTFQVDGGSYIRP